MGHYMEMTRQTQQVFLYAPIYKYWYDVTMTRDWDIWTIMNVRTDQNPTIDNFDFDLWMSKNTFQKLRYDNDCFEP